MGELGVKGLSLEGLGTMTVLVLAVSVPVLRFLLCYIPWGG